MYNYAGVFKVMNAVVFYSNTGQSKSVAEFLSNQLGYALMDIEEVVLEEYENLVLVFPVYCQNIPDLVKGFLRKITVVNLTTIATYGKMCPGNVLYEIQKKYCFNIIAGAYVPTKHSYIEEDDIFDDFEKLSLLIDKIQNPSLVQIPTRYKNPFANAFPKLRTQIGLKIKKSADCNGCNQCGMNCSCGAIRNGVTNSNCIRCLKCVKICPHQALKVQKGFWLKTYLRKKKMNEIIIYV